MCKYDQPREKMIQRGAASLSDVELLQVIVGSGIKNSDHKLIARNLNFVIQTIGIENMTIDDVKNIRGVGDAKAAMILATLEYWSRRFVKHTAPVIDSPERAAEQFSYISEKKQEYFSMLTLDGARRLIKKRTITVGTLMASLVHPREVFSPAIEDRAASIIVGHNHPSMTLDVSENDKEVTKRIRQSGDILGIQLDDHIIVAGNEFVSVI